MISKELFSKAIESVRVQMSNDKINGDLIQEAFGVNESFKYNNDLLIVTIIELLHEYFPKDEDNFSEIEHYIFDTNFGKPTSESKWKSPGELYDELINKN